MSAFKNNPNKEIPFDQLEDGMLVQVDICQYKDKIVRLSEHKKGELYKALDPYTLQPLDSAITISEKTNVKPITQTDQNEVESALAASHYSLMKFVVLRDDVDESPKLWKVINITTDLSAITIQAVDPQYENEELKIERALDLRYAKDHEKPTTSRTVSAQTTQMETNTGLGPKSSILDKKPQTSAFKRHAAIQKLSELMNEATQNIVKLDQTKTKEIAALLNLVPEDKREEAAKLLQPIFNINAQQAKLMLEAVPEANQSVESPISQEQQTQLGEILENSNVPLHRFH